MIAVLLLFVALGLDTLGVAIGLGVARLPRARWPAVGLTFAAFEALMPVVGLIAGARLAHTLGEAAGYVAAGLLILIGALSIREAVSADEGEVSSEECPVTSEAGQSPPITRNSSLVTSHAAARGPLDRPLVLLGLSVSLDELALGFSLGVLRVPVGPALGYIAVQAFVLTFAGLSAGQRLSGRFGEQAELASGIILTLLGIAMLISQVTGFHLL